MEISMEGKLSPIQVRFKEIYTLPFCGLIFSPGASLFWPEGPKSPGGTWQQCLRRQVEPQWALLHCSVFSLPAYIKRYLERWSSFWSTLQRSWRCWRRGSAIACTRTFRRSYASCHSRGVIKRWRLSWLTHSALVYDRKCGGRGEVRGQPMSTAVSFMPIPFEAMPFQADACHIDACFV